MSKQIKKLLVANRSEIAIRVFRSAHEMGIRTVAVYTHEDRYALHRFKADEAYQIGEEGEPIRNYLNVDIIIDICKKHNIDAVHPGYGFLSERPDFARACEENGIIFVGPSVDALDRLGDKTSARQLAEAAKVPVLGGSKEAIKNVAEGKGIARSLGFPVILKAAHGGGGRGMRVVKTEDDFEGQFEQAQRESITAFNSPDIFVEKFIERARHIEVQLMGDQHGNLVHLYERDCSVQRRHQKVVEIAPAPNLDADVRKSLCDCAISIGKEVGYSNAGTVEFLLDDDTQKFYFIEVNPRIQVEHTVTEEVTGIDVVKTQILVAQGCALGGEEINLGSQDDIQTQGFALQSRVTTEDPSNNFMPDYGRVAHYRSAAGMGIRLDAGSAFSGAVVNPYYDSMLVKVTARSRRFSDAINRMDRALSEFRIRGVKTNIPFLKSVLKHQTFKDGKCTTRFIDQTPELFDFPERKDRATKLLKYIGEVQVNGNELVKDRPVATRREAAPVPQVPVGAEPAAGWRQDFKELGPQKFIQKVLDHKGLLITDTSFRDAHQSLLATRVRTQDLVNVAGAYSHLVPNLFSMEMWGGATFDTSMRFLKEDPWERLASMRAKVPNILFQMLLRASSAVGYSNYPDNIVKSFVKESCDAGMDIFRIFDALNWTPNMKVAMEAVNEYGGLCEATICYSGDLLNPSRNKYDLKYYVSMAKELEKMGAHMIALKDMAGLLKPQAAKLLIKALKEEVGLPIHYHTHDTAGIQAASILNGAGQGLDIADAAMAPLSGNTSQVNLNTLVESLRFGERDTGLNVDHLDSLAEYWRCTREFYTPFEAAVLPATADLYHHEMPGGQYTNLYQQARALGLGDQWSKVCEAYAQANKLFGDIVKVTPTSKAVGDMALFMVANDLSPEDVLNPERELAFPASVIDLVGGMMGQPVGGFPENISHVVLRGKEGLKERPGDLLPEANFAEAKEKVSLLLQREPLDREVISYLLYPKVFEDFAHHQVNYTDTSHLPTPVFFYGLESGEEISTDIEMGKTLIIKFLTIGEATPEGKRRVFFELNGQPRDVLIQDLSLDSVSGGSIKADESNPEHVGSSMPGMVVNLAITVGDKVKKGQKLLVLEAMKMETTIYAEQDGKVDQIHVAPGSQVDTGDLLVVIKS
jgi:pyruvate carboxylase